MRITVLSTHTNNCPTFYKPLWELGHQLSIIIYDLISNEDMSFLPMMVDANRPDWVLYIGAHENFHPRPVPKVDVLAKIGAKYPLVHLCCDGAESVWWPQIQRYYDEGRFALQINIDGVRTGPIGERGLTMLSPFGDEDFPDADDIPWNKRNVLLGFGGNRGGGRRGQMLDGLVNSGMITHRPRDDDASISEYYKFLMTCKCTWNHSETGSSDHLHIKGRPLEAALAGSLLFETKGSPLEDWFEPGQDYLSYETQSDIAGLLDFVKAKPKEAEKIARSMMGKVVRDHSPEVFWSHVLERLGMGKAKTKLKQPNIRVWNGAKAAPAQKADPNQPILVGSGRQSNIVRYLNFYYVVPQRLGPLDLSLSTDRSRNGIRHFETLEQAQMHL